MTKRVQAKYKINRRLGLNLWGRPKNKKEYGPGQHGQRRKKTSDYGLQLMAKQKLKGYYGNITERQFRKIYAEAVRRKGDTGQNLVELLERRLDAAVYRLKFAPTVFAARQLVSHGHVRVNGRKVDISSYSLKDGDVVELKDKAKQLIHVMEALASQERQVPDYYQVGGEPTKGTFVRGPKLGDVPYPVQMEPNLVIEFYSR